MKLTTPQKKQLTRRLAELSTHGMGSYYDHPSGFFSGVCHALEEVGLELEDMPPTIYTTNGEDTLGVITHDTQSGSNPLFYVVVTWYQMPSNRWEMLAYTTL